MLTYNLFFVKIYLMLNKELNYKRECWRELRVGFFNCWYEYPTTPKKVWIVRGGGNKDECFENF